MKPDISKAWHNQIVNPKEAFRDLEPGMSVFVGTGASEPRQLIRHLMETDSYNVVDLELIQIVSFGPAITPEGMSGGKFRLRTFFPVRMSAEAIAEGRVDYIPCRFSGIPHLIRSGHIQIDVALVQITPPNRAGYCSFGISTDVARYAMDQADITIGEITSKIPVTNGDTYVHLNEFDYVIQSDEEPFYFPRWRPSETFDKIAAHVASLIDSGSCIGFSLGPLYEALAPYLKEKRNLGIHSPVFTDAAMDVVNSGAVTNRSKGIFKGKSAVSYAVGTPELMQWLNDNPLVEFQGVDEIFNPLKIGMNPGFVAIVTARQVSVSGEVSLHFGKGNAAVGPAEALDFIQGAQLSEGGLTIMALPSRRGDGSSNITVSLEEGEGFYGLRESVDMVVTDYGVANLKGRTIRERAQALIEVAHPDDRAGLVEAAKAQNILYKDQIFLPESQHLYPSDIETTQTFKGGLKVRFRAIKPSDEEEMRRLFYRFSDQSVYYRYFVPVKSMPHAKMQAYVNVDYNSTMSIVGLVGNAGGGRIIAEARYVKHRDKPLGDVAFVVDEQYQGKGIASYLLGMLITIGREKGLKGFTADVLASNKSMMKVFEKAGLHVKARFDEGAYSFTMLFEEDAAA